MVLQLHEETAEVIPLFGRGNLAEVRQAQADFAKITRLLHQAHSATAEVHALACKRRKAHPVTGDRINTLQVEVLDQMVEYSGVAEDATTRALETSAVIPPRIRAMGSWP